MNLPRPTVLIDEASKQLFELQECPAHITANHWREWYESRVDPEIVALNVESLSDLELDDHSHEADRPIAERLNWRVTQGYRIYDEIHGWWASGVDPLNHYQRME